MENAKRGWRRRLAVDLDRPEPRALEAASRAVDRGEVLLYPTDTVYGFGCHGFCEPAIERILQLKRRAAGKGLLLLIPDLKSAATLSRRLPRQFHRLAARLWPGPVTFLVPAAPSLPAAITGSQGKVGLRYPSLPFLRLWLKRLAAPPAPIWRASRLRNPDHGWKTYSARKSTFFWTRDRFADRCLPRSWIYARRHPGSSGRARWTKRSSAYWQGKSIPCRWRLRSVCGLGIGRMLSV